MKYRENNSLGEDNPTRLDPTVFLIDEEKDFRESLVKLFVANEIPVESFDSAATFLSKIAGRRVGCIVTELELPGESGLDLLSAVRNREWGIPQVVLTKSNKISDCSKAFRHGVADYFLKPLQVPCEFIDRIRECFDQDKKAFVYESRLSEMQSRFDGCPATTRWDDHEGHRGRIQQNLSSDFKDSSQAIVEVGIR